MEVSQMEDRQDATLFAAANLPTETQLQEAYRELKQAIHSHLKHGLEFGRMCYQLQQHHRRRGREGEGFKAMLIKLDIKKRTAYRWIANYKERQPSATWHQVEAKSKHGRAKVTSDGQNVQLEFDLPADYPRKQWDDDVKLLGGRQKVRKLFVDEFLPEVHKRAEAKRHEQHQPGSVQ